MLYTAVTSNTVDFDLLLGSDALLDKELSEVSSEITLQLDNESLLLVFDHGSVAMEHFLEGTEELLVVQVVRQTLHNGQALTGSTLLIVQIYKRIS